MKLPTRIFFCCPKALAALFLFAGCSGSGVAPEEFAETRNSVRRNSQAVDSLNEKIAELEGNRPSRGVARPNTDLILNAIRPLNVRILTLETDLQALINDTEVGQSVGDKNAQKTLNLEHRVKLLENELLLVRKELRALNESLGRGMGAGQDPLSESLRKTSEGLSQGPSASAKVIQSPPAVLVLPAAGDGTVNKVSGKSSPAKETPPVAAAKNDVSADEPPPAQTPPSRSAGGDDFERGSEAYQNARYAQAAEHFKSFLKTSTDKALRTEAFALLGISSYEMGQYSLAQYYLKEARAGFTNPDAPENARVYWHLGLSYEQTGDQSVARELFREAAKFEGELGELARKKLSQAESAN